MVDATSSWNRPSHRADGGGAAGRRRGARRIERERWRARAAGHAARLEPYLAPHRARRAEGRRHPVYDFLFAYYTLSPAKLRRWHPGYGTTLIGGGRRYGALRGYGGDDDVAVTRAHLLDQLPLVEQIAGLLTATAGRAAATGCFGMHEWAMAYRRAPEQIRHSDWPLRLGPDGTDRVVERHRIACTHFDAYRFFTPAALPLNTVRPRADDRERFEQPGCLHANMDLYKHAFRLLPLICSDLVADCFELAWDVRAVDMRASPYDLRALGFAPIAVETVAGKREYVVHQRAFAARAAPLRQRLIAACERLLGAARA